MSDRSDANAAPPPSETPPSGAPPADAPSEDSSQPVQLRFYRPDLERLPEPEVPAGYLLRHYRPGDESGWASALAAAFEEENWTTERIEGEFLKRPQFHPERIFLVESDGRIVGAAAAWERDDPEEGYVHWVGVEPSHQGRRLGRLLTLATLHRFRDEGKWTAILDTDEFRTAACATYLSLGFLPLLDSPERERMWKTVTMALGIHPEDAFDDSA